MFYKILKSIVQSHVVVAAFLIFAIALVSCSSEPEQESAAVGAQEKTSADSTAKQAKAKTIVFYGNSLTAGYGLEPNQAFPALIQHRIDSLKLNYTVVNAGVSGETSSGGLGRIDWILSQPVDIFVLELGANDGLRGISPDETKKNLQAIMDKVKEKYPSARIILAGMQVPPNMGSRFSEQFRNVFTDLARENQVSLIPFILEGVGGETALNQQDGIHPTAEGHHILADNVWEILYPML